MVQACKPQAPAHRNPGVVLGVILGTLAKAGRDKVTLIASPEISSLGAWLEQLLAESTGKDGKGLVPVEGEPVGTPGVYGEDRLFLHLRLDSSRNRKQEQAVTDLKRSGHPVVQISMADRYDLGQEVFRWEMATAVAGSLLEINPFNQPDVEASKTATRDLTRRFEREGSFPRETAFFSQGGISLLADEEYRNLLSEGRGGRPHRGIHSQGSPGAALPGRLLRDFGLPRDEPPSPEAASEFEAAGPGPVWGGHLSGIRSALSALDRSSLQGRPQQRSLSADHRRGPAGFAGARPEIHLWGRKDRPGQGGFFRCLNQRGRRALRIHLSAPLEQGLRQLTRAVDTASASA